MHQTYDKYLTSFEHKMAEFANLAYYMENGNEDYKENLQKKMADINDCKVVIADDNTAIIENTAQKEVYLLVTGTRLSVEQYSKMHMIEDCCEDIDLFVWKHAMPRMQKISKMIEHSEYCKNKTVYATGHSLGGFIVNRLAEKYDWLQCYSFNAPGVAHHLNTKTDVTITLNNLHTYRIDTDIISNKIGKILYLGKVNKVFPHVNHDTSAHSILNFTSLLIGDFE